MKANGNTGYAGLIKFDGSKKRIRFIYPNKKIALWKLHSTISKL
jgi:hypothetical protein